MVTKQSKRKWRSENSADCRCLKPQDNMQLRSGCNLQDRISPRKQKENAFASSNSMLEGVINSHKYGMLVCSFKLTFYINRANASIYFSQSTYLDCIKLSQSPHPRHFCNFIRHRTRCSLNRHKSSSC